ncbi:MAG TPA: hypothetical protein PK175_02350 [Syntrophales bacterium]|nr:hypothetical protein [Syntrophales bacterium]HON22509.1 hypothetical protein [Syntrophales bacterium]HOU78126.1 hypothetical protein [Syntrophales bacterium]HPC32135.1 hypothetical protein [Syntrophales bacterium]HQG33698.1 hypothetical protein [Syntrophales bacterium]
MLKVIADPQTVRRCQQLLVRRIRAAGGEKIPVVMGHQGASIRGRVWWSDRLGLWFFPGGGEENRYWNAFGTARPKPDASLSITCEINFPKEGIDRRIGGAFAVDGRGRIFVVHRGKLGGGRKGIGKALFERQYRGVWVEMDDDGEEVFVAVVGHLSSPRFARQVAQFVGKIERIKDRAASSAQTEMGFDDLRLREELLGMRQCELLRETAGECDHGLIVKDLAAAVRNLHFRSGNDGLRDLMVMDRQGQTAIFQVKTDNRYRSVQEGATQLLVNSLLLPRPPRLILVLPEPPENATVKKLQRLNIHVLIYRWEGETAVFPELRSLLNGF